MKTKLTTFLSNFDWIYNFAIKLMAHRIIRGDNPLRPEHLEIMGFVKDGDYYVEPNIKLRDKVWVQFEAHYYRVFHGGDRTFIALQSRKEWFDNHYLLVNGIRLYDLAGI